jgi:UDP-glucuronate 4-epimerase
MKENSVNKKYLVTGAAGFIGAEVCKRLLSKGFEVVGIDNINDYYDINLKKDRLKQIPEHNFSFLQQDISDRFAIAKLFENENFDVVIHLAAQAGVRYSIENPHAYADSNLIGHLNILEGCRNTRVQHLVYASSSSVYGLNEKTPFETSDSVDHPISLYAATKKIERVNVA